MDISKSICDQDMYKGFEFDEKTFHFSVEVAGCDVVIFTESWQMAMCMN